MQQAHEFPLALSVDLQSRHVRTSAGGSFLRSVADGLHSYIERNLWSGDGGMTNPGGGAQGTDNIFETSFRYYLP